MPIQLIQVGETKDVEVGGGTVTIKRVNRADWLRMIGNLNELAPDTESATGILTEWDRFCEMLSTCISAIDGNSDNVADTLKAIDDVSVVMQIQMAVYEYNEPQGGMAGNSPSSRDGSSPDGTSQTAGDVSTADV